MRSRRPRRAQNMANEPVALKAPLRQRATQMQRLGGQTGQFRVEAAVAGAAVAGGNSARLAGGSRGLAGRGAEHRSRARC
jgi:hypothetical protein